MWSPAGRTPLAVRNEGAENNEIFQNKNQERINFVSNILSQGNPLLSNPSKQRVLIGKGPVAFEKEMMKAGSIFLFTDLLIVATRVISNRRYVREICFNREELTVVKSEEDTRTLSDLSGKYLEIKFEDSDLAGLWDQYLSFKQQQTNDGN